MLLKICLKCKPPPEPLRFQWTAPWGTQHGSPTLFAESECSVFVRTITTNTTIAIIILWVDAVLNVVVDEGYLSLANCQNHIRVALSTKDCLMMMVMIIIIIIIMVDNLVGLDEVPGTQNVDVEHPLHSWHPVLLNRLAYKEGES